MNVEKEQKLGTISFVRRATAAFLRLKKFYSIIYPPLVIFISKNIFRLVYSWYCIYQVFFITKSSFCSVQKTRPN